MEAADGSHGDDCAAAATNRESEESEEARRVRALEVEVKNLCAQVDRRGWDSIGGHPLGPRCRFWVAALLPWTRTGGRILYHLQPTHALDASHNYDGILSFFSLYYVFFGIFAMEQVGRRVPSLSSQACLQRLSTIDSRAVACRRTDLCDRATIWSGRGRWQRRRSLGRTAMGDIAFHLRRARIGVHSWSLLLLEYVASAHGERRSPSKGLLPGASEPRQSAVLVWAYLIAALHFHVRHGARGCHSSAWHFRCHLRYGVGRDQLDHGGRTVHIPQLCGHAVRCGWPVGLCSRAGTQQYRGRSSSVVVTAPILNTVSSGVISGLGK